MKLTKNELITWYLCITAGSTAIALPVGYGIAWVIRTLF